MQFKKVAKDFSAGFYYVGIISCIFQPERVPHSGRTGRNKKFANDFLYATIFEAQFRLGSYILIFVRDNVIGEGLGHASVESGNAVSWQSSDPRTDQKRLIECTD